MSSEATFAAARPTSVDELVAVMSEAAAGGLVVGVRGGGSKLGWVAPGAPVDLTIDTRGLDRIGPHAAGDLVVTAQAGVTLAALQEHVAAEAQWLALDPPESGATIGGIVASAASGPRRLRFGTPRDLLIGITVVLANGTIAHSGGRVVKNVAGYDLAKLFTGSFGTLGVVAECTFRLHPLAAGRRVVRVSGVDPVAAMGSIDRTGTAPVAVEWDGTTLTVLFESSAATAQAQADQVRASVGGEVGTDLPPGFGERPWLGAPLGLKVTHRLGALREVLDALGSRLPGSRLAAHVGSGVIWVGADDDGSTVEPLRQEIAWHDGAVVVVHAPAGVERAVDVWGPVRGLEIMRRIKAEFDPDHRLAPGTFVGGI
jgi:glycolate oxidase FAD binding subunit